MTQRPYTVVLLVPTGVGAAIGGYAGDALPVARAIAQIAARLITHPNVLNGAQLYWPMSNSFYVEGYGLDQFAAMNWGLRPVHQNRVGLILDAAIEPDLRWRQLQAADATKATLGLNLTDYVVTDMPLHVELRRTSGGASWGTIGHPESLLRAAETLITKAGAEAIAVVARFPDAPDSEALQQYQHGSGIDPIAVYEVQKILRRLREQGLGILITDHNVRETLKLVDRAYLIHRGEVVYEGVGVQMLEDPRAREIYLGPEFNL